MSDLRQQHSQEQLVEEIRVTQNIGDQNNTNREEANQLGAKFSLNGVQSNDANNGSSEEDQVITKKQNKLMNNLSSLTQAGLNLSQGIQKRFLEIQDKSNAQLQKQQEHQLSLEGKLSTYQNLKEGTLKELEEKQVVLSDLQEQTVRRKNEIMTLKQLQDRLLEELASENDELLKEKTQKVKDITDQVEELKMKIRKEKQRRQELEEKIEDSEEQRALLAARLQELGSQTGSKMSLEYTSVDFDKEVSLQLRLKEKLQAAKLLKQEWIEKNKGYVAESEKLSIKLESLKQVVISQEANVSKRDQLQLKLDQIKYSNKSAFDLNLSLLEKLKYLQISVQMDTTKSFELIEIANLLKDQNRFEKFSRRIQVIIEWWEDEQRSQEDQLKELLTNLRFVKQESEINNDALEGELVQFDQDLQETVKQKNDLTDEIKIVMMKVCNKNPSELKIEMIDQYLASLITYEKQLVERQDNSNKMKAKLGVLARQCFDFEKSVKEQIYNKTYELIEDNARLIIKTDGDLKDVGVRLDSLDQTLQDQASESEEQLIKVESLKSQVQQAQIIFKRIKGGLDNERIIHSECKDDQETNKELLAIPFREKSSAVAEQSNITEFVSAQTQSKEQNDRLNEMQLKDLKDLENLIGNLQEEVSKLEESLVGDKVDQCKKLLSDGHKHCNDLGSAIGELENKLKLLRDNLNKADPEEQRQLLKEIDKVQEDINALKKAKDQLEKQLDLIGKQGEEDFIQHQKQIKNILGQLQGLQNKDLKDRERDIDGIEAKLRNAIRKRRFNKRKECQDELDKAKANIQQLIQLLEQLKQKQDHLGKDSQVLEQAYPYKDQERSIEVAEKILQPLDDSKDKYADFDNKKRRVQEQINRLNQEFEDLSGALIGNQALVDSTSNGGGKSEDEVVQMWAACTDRVRAIEQDSQNQVQQAQQETENVEELQQLLGELNEKFKNKNLVYKQCLSKKKEKENILKDQMINLDLVSAKVEEIEQLMSKVILPHDEESSQQFITTYNNKLREIDEVKQKLSQQQHQQEQLQQKLYSIVEKLPKIGDQVVTYREIQDIKNDLDRLDLEFTYLKDEIKALDAECDDLSASAKKVFEENKKILVKETDQIKDILGNDLAFLDTLHKEVADKMAEYNGRINEGMFSDDEDLRSQLKILSDEALLLQKDLNQQERAKNVLKQQEKGFKEELKSLKANLKKVQNVEDFLNLTKCFKQVGETSLTVKSELERIKAELDTRLLEIDTFINKYNEMHSMYAEFDQMMADFRQNNKKFQNKVDDSTILTQQLEAVLDEMQKGVKTDYKLKVNFIAEEKEELETVRKQLEQLEQVKQSMEPKVQLLKRNASASLDADGLQQLITDTMEVIEVLENADKKANQCVARLKQIREDIGIADVPELTKQREQEVVEFSAKLRKIEQEVLEFRKQIGSNSKGTDGFDDSEVGQELRSIEQMILQFKEERQNFKRILGQDLLIYLPQPKALEDLQTLRVVIKKLRELGISVNQYIDRLDQMQIVTYRLRRQLGGIDLMKRHNEVKYTEEDQRKRLEQVKNRLDRIAKGAQDCDGYTSNTEEATFIETLLSEIPEMKEKHGEACMECDSVKESLFHIKQVIEKIARNEADESSASEVNASLEQVEEQSSLNERTVSFLEKLIEKLEEHFLQMDVKKKLEKRQMELKELQNICQDFEEQLMDMHHHILKDMTKIDEKKKFGSGLQEMLVDKDGNPVNLLEEITTVHNELQDILFGVIELQEKNKEIQERRDEAEREFQEQIMKKTPFKGQAKITNKHDVFSLLKANGWMKKRIVDMIKTLKDVSRRMRESKHKYQVVRTKIEKHNRPKKLYRAVKGDMVDELFADYINKLNCPVPIKRLGNNQYTFGTKKIFAKIINGKLVIRVGGGYMGIEEFMMYYGQQELSKIQKAEYLNSEENEQGLLSGTDTLSDEEQESKETGRRSNANMLDIDNLKQKLREQSGKKMRKRDKSFGEEPVPQTNKATTVVGIGDVRKAMRTNIFEINTYQEHSSMGMSGFGSAQKSKLAGKKVIKGEKELLEKQLKTMEKNIGNKLKEKMSPKRTEVNRPMTAYKSGSQKKLDISRDSQDSNHSSKNEQQEEKKPAKRTLFQASSQSKIPQFKRTQQQNTPNDE